MAAYPGSKNFVLLSYHGGMCCGMNHIHDFGTFHNPVKPTTLLEARPTETASAYKERMAYYPRTGNRTLYEFPEQTAGDRFDSCILKAKRRLKGIIEVVLMPTQLAAWRLFIEARGFRIVSAAKNSNTGNVIRVFHYVYGQDPVELD